MSETRAFLLILLHRLPLIIGDRLDPEQNLRRHRRAIVPEVDDRLGIVDAAQVVAVKRLDIVEDGAGRVRTDERLDRDCVVSVQRSKPL